MATGRGRTPTAPWSRLRPVNLDPLEEMGLPSKGDNRLLNFKEQEKYYKLIVDRYMSFCSTSGDSLLHRLSALSLSTSPASPSLPQTQPQRPSRTIPPAIPPRNSSSYVPSASEGNSNLKNDASTLLMSSRKLREALLASRRADPFALTCYTFIIRLSILCKSFESYHPALLHLLYRLHPHCPLQNSELQEFAGYLVLDLACRQNDLMGAHRARVRFGVTSRAVLGVLGALVRDDWVIWERTRRGVDGYVGRLMEWRGSEVKEHTLKCVGRSYLTVDLVFLERVTGSSWSELVKEHNIGWTLMDGKVTVRKPKAK